MKGLPNYGNYCFLNTAIQQLYAIKDFRKKIMDVDTVTPNSPVCLDTKTYRPLISLKKLFEYLYGRRSAGPREIELWMKDLGYSGNQDDSAEIRDKLLEKIKILLKKLKGKTLSPTSLGNIINVNFQSGKVLDAFIESACDESEHSGKTLTVNLKNKCIIVNIRRSDESAELVDIFPDLDLTYLVSSQKIQILSGKKPINRAPVFKIISAAIYMSDNIYNDYDSSYGSDLGFDFNSTYTGGFGDSGHYVTINRHGNNKWAYIDDEYVRENLSWTDVKDMMKCAASIIYELI